MRQSHATQLGHHWQVRRLSLQKRWQRSVRHPFEINAGCRRQFFESIRIVSYVFPLLRLYCESIETFSALQNTLFRKWLVCAETWPVAGILRHNHSEYGWIHVER